MVNRLELHEQIIANERVWGIGHAAARDIASSELVDSPDDGEVVGEISVAQIDAIVLPLLEL